MNNKLVTRHTSHVSRLTFKACNLQPALRVTCYVLPVTLILLWLILLPQAKALATTYYLDIDGVGEDGILGTDDVISSDANPGTSEQPWKTMARAMQNYSGAGTKVQKGDIVILRAGNYGDVVFSYIPPSASSSWGDKITYISETLHTAVFTRLSISGNYHRYLEFNGIKITPNAFIGAVSVSASDYLRFISLDIQGTWDEATYGPGISDTNLYNSLSGGMYITESSAYLMNDIIIENCGLQDLKNAITFANNAGTGTKVVNCTIHHLAGSAIYIVVDNKGTNGQILIEGNHIYNQQFVWSGTGPMHGTGIDLRSNNVIIRGNIIHNFGNTAGMKAYQSVFPETGYTDMLIENNLLYDSLGNPMLQLVDVGSNFIVRNNTIIGYYTADEDLGWKYYVAMSISFASSISDGSGFSLYNNVIVGRVDVPEGLNDQQYISTMNEGKNIIWCLSGDNSGNAWNVSLPPGSTSKVISGRYDPFPGYTADYFEGSAKQPFFVGGSDFDTYSYTRPGGKPHGINLNDAYKLADGSDAIGFADPAYAPATDLLGNPRDAQPDAGAYEYISSTPPPPSILFGDVSGDGQVTAYDAALTAQAAVGLITLTPDQTKAADVSGNGEVSAYDAALIAQKAVGLIDKFPVE